MCEEGREDVGALDRILGMRLRRRVHTTHHEAGGAHEAGVGHGSV